MKLFVDVDDTLILYTQNHTWNLEDTVSYTVNVPLIDALEKWQKIYPDEYLIIWSGTGTEWASEVTKAFLTHLNVHMTGSKLSLADMTTSQDLAIEDRPQGSRHYLRRFGKVFSPDEFIQNVAADITIEQLERQGKIEPLSAHQTVLLERLKLGKQ